MKKLRTKVFLTIFSILTIFTLLIFITSTSKYYLERKNSISGILNVLLNLFFVIVFKMGVPGVAWATIISQGLSALLIVLALLKSKGFFEFNFKEIRFYKRDSSSNYTYPIVNNTSIVTFTAS